MKETMQSVVFESVELKNSANNQDSFSFKQEAAENKFRYITFTVLRETVKEYMDSRNMLTLSPFYDNDQKTMKNFYSYALQKGAVIKTHISYTDDYYDLYEEYVINAKEHGYPILTKESFFCNVYPYLDECECDEKKPVTKEERIPDLIKQVYEALREEKKVRPLNDEELKEAVKQITESYKRKKFDYLTENDFVTSVINYAADVFKQEYENLPSRVILQHKESGTTVSFPVSFELEDVSNDGTFTDEQLEEIHNRYEKICKVSISLMEIVRVKKRRK